MMIENPLMKTFIFFLKEVYLTSLIKNANSIDNTSTKESPMSHIISHKRKLLMLLVILGYSQVSFAMEAIDGDAAAAAAPTSPEKSPFVLGARKQNAEAGRKKKANPKVPRVDPRTYLNKKILSFQKNLSQKFIN